MNNYTTRAIDRARLTRTEPFKFGSVIKSLSDEAQQELDRLVAEAHAEDKKQRDELSLLLGRLGLTDDDYRAALAAEAGAK